MKSLHQALEEETEHLKQKVEQSAAEQEAKKKS
jgi:hypothetical protein